MKASKFKRILRGWSRMVELLLNNNNNDQNVMENWLQTPFLELKTLSVQYSPQTTRNYKRHNSESTWWFTHLKSLNQKQKQGDLCLEVPCHHLQPHFTHELKGFQHIFPHTLRLTSQPTPCHHIARHWRQTEGRWEKISLGVS